LVPEEAKIILRSFIITLLLRQFMGDIGTDSESQLEMLLEAYKKLQSKNPSHELLKLVEPHTDGQGFTSTKEYFRRCVRGSDKWRIPGYARYTKALENAANGLPVLLLDTHPPCEF
jgi:hypothetical protein